MKSKFLASETSSSSSESITGPQLQERSYATWASLLFYTRKRHMPVLAMALSATLTAASLKTLLSVFLGRIFDVVSRFGEGTQTGSSALSDVSAWCLALTGLGVGSWLANTSFVSLWIIFGELQACEARKELQKKLLAQQVEWFASLSDGVEGLHTRIHTQIRELQAAVSQVMGFALCDLMTACGSLIIAFYHSWKLALALLATLPISFLFLGIATRSLDLHVSLQKQFLQRASTSAAASIHGIDVVRVFAGFHREQNRYGHVLTLASRHFLAQARCNAIQIGYIAFWSISIFALGFWYGIVLVNQGVPPGHIITAFYALLTTFQGVESLAGYWLVLSKGKSAAFFLSYTESIVDEHAHGDLQSTELDICEGQETGIQLDKVNFAYKTTPYVRVLQDTSINFPGKQLSFLVGQCGSGKSTVCGLIAGLLKPSRGEITVLGHSLKQIPASRLCQYVTLIHQNSPVIHDTFFNNVAIGRRKGRISMTDIQQACKFAKLEHTISGFRGGLNTVIDTDSRQLSGGQRQRLAMARAWLRDTPILILDEPTSALDPSSQIAMMKSIREWRKNKTTIIVTHDLSVIEEQDFVCEMRNGSVYRQGRLNELDLKGESGRGLKVTGCDLVSNSRRKQPLANHILRKIQRLSIAHAQQNAGFLSPIPRSYARHSSHSTDYRNSTIACWGLREDSEIQRRQFSTYLDRHFNMHDIITSLQNPQHYGQSIDGQHLGQDLTDIHTRWHEGPTFGRVDSMWTEKGHGHAPDSEFDEPSLKSQRGDHHSMRTILSSIWPSLGYRDRLAVLCAFGLCIVGAAATPIFAYCFAKLLEAIWAARDREGTGLKWAGSLLGIAVADGLCAAGGHYLFDKVGQVWVDNLRKDAFGNILGQPDLWFRNTASRVVLFGQCLDRNGQEMRTIIGKFLPVAIVVVAITSISVVWAMIVCWRLTLVTLSTLPLVILVIKTYSAVSSRWEKNCNDAATDSSAVLKEILVNFEFVRAFGLNPYFQSRQEDSADRCFRTGLKRALHTAPLFGLYQCISLPLTALIFYYGTLIITQNEAISIGHVMQAINLLLFSIGMSFELLNNLPQLATARVAAAELLDYVNMPGRSADSPRSFTSPNSPMPVRMDNIHFTPGPHYLKVLDGFSLDVHRGCFLAIVGPSGSGKSTLLSILLGINQPDNLFSGEGWPAKSSLTFGGVPWSDVDIRDLRSEMALVPQKPFLFPASIGENIAYGLQTSRLDSCRDIIVRAAKEAGAHDFISSLPEGYNTIVGDGGQALSGGQAQLVNIARALAKRPRLLVLDEPTSALDAESAGIVGEALKNFIYEAKDSSDDLAVVIATHNVEMMKLMTEVIVIDGGRKVEQGSYDRLLAERGYLWRLVASE